MLTRRWRVCALAALFFGGTLAAQQPGTLLVGGFGQYTIFDDGLNLENMFGGGGRIGAVIAPNWHIEYEGSYTEADSDVGAGKTKYSVWAARLMYSYPFAGRTSFHFGAGPVLSTFRPDVFNPLADLYKFGANADVGLKWGLGNNAALRFDALVDYHPTDPSVTNFRVQAGLDFMANLSEWMGWENNATGPVVWWNDQPQPTPGTIELGGFAGYNFFGNEAGDPSFYHPEDGLSYGGRLGVFLTPTWSLEGDGEYGQMDDEVAAGGVQKIDYSTQALRLLWNNPVGNRHSWFVGGGAVRTSYRRTYNYGASGIAGVRIGIANRTSLRFDGFVNYMPTPENLNYGARAGLSFMLGGSTVVAAVDTTPAPLPPPPPPPAPTPAPLPPAPAPAPVVDTLAITGPIYFDFDKSDIRSDAAATLDRKIPWLQANPGMRIRIEGNADERGSDEYNIALGQRRAASAKKYLTDRGIAADRFDLVSYGEERPVCTDKTEECWQRNRRDDFVIVTVGGNGSIVIPAGL